MGNGGGKQGLTDKNINVLCFGDSLTKGYYLDPDNWYTHPDTKLPAYIFYSPYGVPLEKHLNNYAKSNKLSTNFVVSIEGQNGECAVDMMPRLHTVLQKYWKHKQNIKKNKSQSKSNSKSQSQDLNTNSNNDFTDSNLTHCFNYCIILAGSNDIGWSKKANDIINAIKNLHFTILGNYSDDNKTEQAMCKTILVTIPQTKHIVQDRVDVNNELRKFVINENKKGNNNIILCDLNKELPYINMDEKLRDELWCDGLHLMPKGYEKMAEIIFQSMKPHIVQYGMDANTDVKKNVLTLESSGGASGKDVKSAQDESKNDDIDESKDNVNDNGK